MMDEVKVAYGNHTRICVIGHQRNDIGNIQLHCVTALVRKTSPALAGMGHRLIDVFFGDIQPSRVVADMESILFRVMVLVWRVDGRPMAGARHRVFAHTAREHRQKYPNGVALGGGDDPPLGDILHTDG